ncbi:tRNA pseudouridine(38-40) synthase TruA [Pseudodesulfovibrio senegalensis]|uniref:tRNA pseudouridine synthase A n=1 Tax=Pseudodesulfovibrio senegalensis TaxID=1721087 RepID=A0A6N6N443_9BACT|nr:tRNA pseudouridine(38-40) synthase TruA [Pseudodesulfovibrio senegalensis]KAB1442952.1 tRNA pseudouridine(38-40) synthase TruA [Pseudodesulfovibrio senegalensis]
MNRIRLRIAYDGTGFCGWQIQPAQRTVQGVLEEAIARIAGTHVRVHGSGRTDSGVHALDQVCHFDVPRARARVPWQRALNALLPDDVSVLDCCLTSPDFHARYSALSKTYAYTLWLEPGFLLPQRRHFVWVCGPVNQSVMVEAAEILLGTHDFACFQNTGTPVADTVRTMTQAEPAPGVCVHEVVWRFSANGFLKQMVRNIMGCLVAVGRGKVSLADVRSILKGKDRTAAPGTAPAQGLCLERVRYPEPAPGSERPCGGENTGERLESGDEPGLGPAGNG